ncbi:MAG: Uma2 family endonuclease [Pseudomonadota bacterium]
MTILHTAIPLQSPKYIHNPRLTVSEAEYWEQYYGNTDVIYEWNNGLLEEKQVSDHINYLMFSWFVEIMHHFLKVRPIAETTGLEFGFRLNLPNQTAIRRPDLGVILNDNPVALYPRDCTYEGVCDMCIEALSDSTKKDEERDTVQKKNEYAASGVKEYYILHDSRKIAFYRLNARGIYVPIKPVGKGVIKSKVLPGFQFRITDLYQRPSLKTMSEDKVYQGFILPFYQEEKRARQKAEQRADAVQAQATEEKKIRQAAEKRIKRLEAKLARLKKN